MQRFAPLAAAILVGACAVPTSGPEPSLSPRAAEAIDPRLPVPDATPAGTLDPQLGARLDELVGQARSGVAPFQAKAAEAERLAAAAGPLASESWIAAEQALSLLIEQYGVTTRAAANIDALAAARIERQGWISPANQQAIGGAAAEVGAISDRQAAAIDRLQRQLAR